MDIEAFLALDNLNFPPGLRQLAPHVFKVKHKYTNTCYALKRVAEDKLAKPTSIEPQEYKALKVMDHKHVLRHYECYKHPDGTCFFLTKLAVGNLSKLDQFEPGKTFLPDKDAAQIIKQVLEALNHIHSKQIVHRDLKPENILVDSPFDSLSRANIVIGGFSKATGVITTDGKTSGMVGSIAYSAPEMLNNSYYNKKVDIWSLGIIIYKLLSGKLPFDGQNDNEIKKQIKEKDIEQEVDWQGISKDAKELIQQCLNRDHQARLSAVQALKAGWIEKLSHARASTAEHGGSSASGSKRARHEHK